MTLKKTFAFVLVGLILCAPVYAKSSCSLSLKPETSGFFLNPILDKVTVVKVSPEAPGAVCLLMVNDEILQLNDKLVVGQRAKAVMSYWKALKPETPRNFKIKRGGVILTVAIK